MSSQSETSEKIDCPKCGKTNIVTVTYTSFGPENQDRETARCADPGCREALTTTKCFSIASKLT